MFRLSFVLVTSLACALAAPSADASPLAVAIELDDLTCQAPTERSAGNTRDEIFVDATALTAAGHATRRLPASRFDDYYEFWAGTVGSARGWTNQDQIPQGRPPLWEGVLQDGEAVTLMVRINEQDNKELPIVKAALQLGLATARPLILDKVAPASNGSTPTPTTTSALVGGLLDAAQRLVDALPATSRDDLIGAFVVTVVNTGTTPTIAWEPIAQLTALPGSSPDRAAWSAAGTSDSRYVVSARVTARPGSTAPPGPARYLGRETDACSADTLRIVGTTGQVTVRKGGTATLTPALDANKFFTWYCGSTKERARCGERSANRLWVRRAPSGRAITWGCFRR